ncbi:E3 ubiquitin-protein ligase hel2 [Galdieria sulphuraria]|nr:E3 ubiquitin-protein ligase hel2 [Galdieria sulphuraria]
MWKVKVKKEHTSTPLNNTKDSVETPVCVICANILVFVALGSCNHYHVCADCSHRLRSLYNDYRCCVCKQTLEKVLVTKLSKVNSLISHSQEEGVVRKPLIDQVDFSTLYMERRTSMFFEEEAIAEKFRNLLRPACSVCLETVTSVNALHTHIQVQHGGRLCNVYNHIRASHPCCLFCRKNLYDDDQLFEHLTQRHETCPICERNGRLYEYYRNYRSLEQHFKEEHFPCLEENCRGLVFATEFELELHKQREHIQTNTSSRRARRVTIQASSLYVGNDSDRRVHSQNTTREERERQRRQFHGARIFFTGEGSTVIGSQPNQPNNVDSFYHQDNDSNIVEQVNSAMDNLNMDHSTTNALSTTTTTTTTTMSRMQPSNTFIIPQSPTCKEEYERRNQALLNTLHEVLTNNYQFGEFMDISKRLRARELEPLEYISKSIDLLGLLHARRILPELISLLPDKQLQKQLQLAACNHTMLASRQLITENQQVIHHRQVNANAPVISDSRHVTDKEFPSLQSSPAQTSSGSSNITRNYASGLWKQLSQAVTNTRPLHSENLEASYPPLSEDQNVTSISSFVDKRKGVWSCSNDVGPSGLEEESSNYSLSYHVKEKKELENFPALSRLQSNDDVSSPQTASSSTYSNKGRVRLRGTNLPRVGMNGFSWESKRNKKIIQAAKNALKETSQRPS